MTTLLEQLQKKFTTKCFPFEKTITHSNFIKKLDTYLNSMSIKDKTPWFIVLRDYTRVSTNPKIKHVEIEMLKLINNDTIEITSITPKKSTKK